ncbi:peptide/nickel transport system ATP-binding protein [Marinospirillum celere]|uniref:Peptide/nickel transport system ATP-binding protein n=1 Tax=Marinospirillum celere TaxID=1122252 RepID=A0A1I1G6U5_9GAMM|nr:oligopeptide/dipeptide ABC transporter ATP-binding protein [Marinospirillum celere]SFC07284.1 peptide/nickel transport system ATP-binding protein [Marinospirillum celere]
MNQAKRPLLEVKDLTCHFDVSKPLLNRILEREPKSFLTAVDEVSFEVNKGETFALVGESGSGKSTIAKLIVDLVHPSSGKIEFDGQSLATSRGQAFKNLRRRMQMIFQDPFASLNPRWPVGELVAEPIYAFGLAKSRAEVNRTVEELLEKVGLSGRDAAKFPHEFSGGQRQRIAIARALSAQPDFLVCDEPTSALDVSVQAQILNLMKDLQDEFGLTYLFISHDMSVVKHMADRIGVLYLGALVENAAAEELFKNPKHPYTRMLLDAIPDHEMTGRKRQAIKGEIPSPIDPPSGCTFHPRCALATGECKVKRPEVVVREGTRVACWEVDRLA